MFMEIKFSKKNLNDEFAVLMERPTPENLIELVFMKNGEEESSQWNMCFNLRRICCVYAFGNREEFNSLFPEGYKDFARVIGITNHLANYFCSYTSADMMIESIKRATGFPFIDWVKLKNRKVREIVFLPDSEDLSIGQDYLESCYNNGEVYRVECGNKDFNFSTFCLSTDFLDRRRKIPFVQRLIGKIDAKMEEVLNKRSARYF